MDDIINNLQIPIPTQRLYSYLGEHVAYTEDIYQNTFKVYTKDIYVSKNLITKGHHNLTCLKMLRSLLLPDDTFIDIGASLGVYSVQVGKYMTEKSKLYAIEPNNIYYELLMQNLYVMNNFSFKIKTFKTFCSELANSPLEIFTSVKNLELLSSEFLLNDHKKNFNSPHLPLDEIVTDINKGLFKLDVVIPCLPVIKGMKKILSTVEKIKMCISRYSIPYYNSLSSSDQQKLLNNWKEVYYFLKNNDFEIFNPHYSGKLHPVNEEFFMSTNYTDLCVVNKSAIPLIEKNNFRWDVINIYPDSLKILDDVNYDTDTIVFSCNSEYLSHGPYWPLEKGSYEFVWNGKIQNSIEITVINNYRDIIAKFILNRRKNKHVFTSARNLNIFEVSVRNINSASVILQYIQLLPV